MIDIYRLIIVDDEYASCELLKKYVTDYCDDFEISGIFHDGDEAIEYLSKNDVELVLTDIKMARVSGIELAKYIYENKPYINVIAVSAYSEFNYAKELMKYGALYYLLKFVDIDEFLEAMELVRSNLSQKNLVNSNRYDELQTEMFFYDLFENNFSSVKEAEKNYCEMEKDSDFETSKCCHISISIENYEDFKEKKWKYNEEMFKNAILNVVRLLNPSLFVMITAFYGNSIELVLFDHGKEIFPDTDLITKEIDATFNLGIAFELSENIFLKDICQGNYQKNENEVVNDLSLKDIHSMDLPPVVSEAVKIIEDNYRYSIVRNEIADKIHINPIYLSKVFKNHTGRTLMTYLCECRMKKAMELAKQGQTVDEICEQVGYSDERAFRRAFKKYTGCSIREYKNIMREPKYEK